MKRRRFMRNNKGHEVIQALKWIYEHDTFTQKEVCEALGWDHRDWSTNHGEMFRPKTDELYSMRYEAVINYLEYVEL